MFRWLNNKKGQNTAEYAILIGVIVAAAIAMQIYVRRGMQARVKEAVDYTQDADTMSGVQGGPNFDLNQYEPYYLATNYETTQRGATSEMLQTGGGVVRQSTQDVTQRVGNQTYSDYRTGNL